MSNLAVATSEKFDVFSILQSTQENGKSLASAYIEGTSAYRSNLANLVGRTVVVSGDGGADTQLSLGANYKISDFKKEIKTLENGNLVEYKVTKLNAHEVGFIVGKIDMNFKQMHEFIVSELYSIDIDETTDIQMDKLKNAYGGVGANTNANTYLIMGAVVVEVIKKSYTEKDVSGETKIPIASLGGALGYNGKLYTQETSFIRTWRIYVDLIPVDNIMKAYK